MKKMNLSLLALISYAGLQASSKNAIDEQTAHNLGFELIEHPFPGATCEGMDTSYYTIKAAERAFNEELQNPTPNIEVRCNFYTKYTQDTFLTKADREAIGKMANKLGGMPIINFSQTLISSASVTVPTDTKPAQESATPSTQKIKSCAGIPLFIKENEEVEEIDMSSPDWEEQLKEKQRLAKENHKAIVKKNNWLFDIGTNYFDDSSSEESSTAVDAQTFSSLIANEQILPACFNLLKKDQQKEYLKKGSVSFPSTKNTQ